MILYECTCKFKGRFPERHERGCPAMFDKEILTIGCTVPYGYIECGCGCGRWLPTPLTKLEVT